MKRNKIIILASIIIGVLVVTLGLTYAAITFNETKGNSQLVLGDIWMHYKETNQLVLNDAMPMDINDYTTYKVNPVMANQEVNELTKCVNHLNSLGIQGDEGESLDNFCKGTGTFYGFTFQENLDNDGFPPELLTYFEDNDIILINDDSIYTLNPIMASQEVVDNELNRCMNYFTEIGFSNELDEGSTTETFCKGTGTLDGMTLQQFWDNAYQQEGFMEQEGNVVVNKNIVISQIENLPYFEFTIDGKNTYTKKDIWYEIVLNHGDNHDTRTTRIRDDLLRFTLVEVIDGTEKVLFNNRKYDGLTNKRIYVNTIPANTNEEINKTYRLYMWISNDIVIGNIDEDYTLDEWNDVFVSIKVNVTGDFNEKELAYEEKYNVTNEKCFLTKEQKIYTHNKNITEDEVALCESYLTNQMGNIEEQYNYVEGETYESFCRGTGSLGQKIFEEFLLLNYFNEEDMMYFEENNIVTISNIGVTIVDYNPSCGDDVVIPKTINGYEVVNFDFCGSLSAEQMNNVTSKEYSNQMFNQSINKVMPIELVCRESFSQIKSIVIPNTVKVIGENTFYNSELTEVTFEENSNLTIIEKMAFFQCNINSITIPNSVVLIGSEAFRFARIKELRFEEKSNLTTIAYSAFSHNLLTSVKIPQSVNELSCYAFDDDVLIDKSDDLVCY